MKPIAFVGGALDDLRDFPDQVHREAGHQLDRVQRGLDPDDWKPMTSVGPGVRMVRVRDETGAFRVIYVATRSNAIHVPHAFRKKTRQTSRRDLDLASSRLRRLVEKGTR